VRDGSTEAKNLERMRGSSADRLGRGDAAPTLTHRSATGHTLDQAPPLGGLGGHACVWEHKGTVAPIDGLDCQCPGLLRCALCARTVTIRCRATRESKCAPCAERHRWDVARVVRSGVTEERLQACLAVVMLGTRAERRQWSVGGGDGRYNGDRPSGFFFVTLTGPGRSVLPWDTSLCGHAPGECSNAPHVRPEGSGVCVVERMRAALWNGRCPRRWNEWITDLRRVLDRDVQYCGSWETQTRGVLHRHVLLYVEGVTESYLQQVGRRIAIRLGFGKQFDVDSISSGESVARTAGYIASYVTKDGDELATCVHPRTGEITQAGYRRWSCSRSWGTTMRAVREERRAWIVGRNDGGGGLGPVVGAADAGPAAGAAGALDSEQESYALIDLLRSVLGAVEV
jgi:hypothetical protein